MKLRYFKGQFIGEEAAGIGLIGQAALDKVAINAVSKLTKGQKARRRKARAKKHKKAVA